MSYWREHPRQQPFHKLIFNFVPFFFVLNKDIGCNCLQIKYTLTIKHEHETLPFNLSLSLLEIHFRFLFIRNFIFGCLKISVVRNEIYCENSMDSYCNDVANANHTVIEYSWNMFTFLLLLLLLLLLCESHMVAYMQFLLSNRLLVCTRVCNVSPIICICEEVVASRFHIHLMKLLCIFDSNWNAKSTWHHLSEHNKFSENV